MALYKYAYYYYYLLLLFKSFYFLPSVVEIPRAKTKLKTRTMLERLHFVLEGCVGEATQDSDCIVALD